MATVTRFYFDDSLQPWLALSDGPPVSLAAGSSLDLPLSHERFCLGFTKKGVHFDCPRSAVISGRQCKYCGQDDDFQPCLKCDGSVCLSDSTEAKEGCREAQYCVYLASFGGKVKAGVSREERLTKRWVEQGADFAQKVFAGLDGRKARRIEARLVEAGLLEYLTAKQKLELLGVTDDEAIGKARDGARVVFEEFKDYAVDGELAGLNEYYPSVVCPVKETAALNGKSEGCKGSLLFLEGGKVFLASDAVARKVVEGGLNAFL